MTEIEDTLIEASQRLLELAVAAAKELNRDDPENLAEADSLCAEKCLSLELSIGRQHGPGGLTSVRLTLNHPTTGERVASLFEVIAAPALGGAH